MAHSDVIFSYAKLPVLRMLGHLQLVVIVSLASVISIEISSLYNMVGVNLTPVLGGGILDNIGNPVYFA